MLWGKFCEKNYPQKFILFSDNLLQKTFDKLSTTKFQKKFCFNFLPEHVPQKTFKLWKIGQWKYKRKHKCKMSIESMAAVEPPDSPLFVPLASAHGIWPSPSCSCHITTPSFIRPCSICFLRCSGPGEKRRKEKGGKEC